MVVIKRVRAEGGWSGSQSKRHVLSYLGKACVSAGEMFETDPTLTHGFVVF